MGNRSGTRRNRFVLEKMNNILYVIDMQPGFKASRSIIREVIKEIKLARRRKDRILFVENRPGVFGSTDKRLIDAAGNNFNILQKLENDGSDMLLQAICPKTTKKIRVCGVNRNACVLATVEGLIKKTDMFKIEVACNATSSHIVNKEWLHWAEITYHRLAQQKKIRLVFNKRY